MEYKYYKNGNIHVRYDSDIDGYTDEHTYGAMLVPHGVKVEYL